MKIKKPLALLLAATMLISVFTTSAFANEEYVVKDGDVLSKIAQEYNTTWQQLAKTNNLSNPNLIYTNQKIVIPDKNNIVNGKKVTVLGTTDMHGRIYAYEYATDSVDKDAGFAKIQTLVKQEKAKNPNAILVDCGDILQDNSSDLFNDLPVHPMIQAMNSMGYDTWTIGNHEFNHNLTFLEKNIKGFNNSVLAANIYKADNTRFVEPYKIFEKDGVRVAVVGLMPPHVPRWEASSPKHYTGLKFTQPVEEAKKVVKELEGKYDVLVGAFHLGLEPEYGSQGAEEIAKQVPEFDVIFCGHAHAKFDDKVVNGVKLIEPGCFGWALAKADIIVENTKDGYAVKDVSVKNIETKEVPEDKKILKEFEFVHNKAKGDANIIVGKIQDDFIKRVDYITGADKVTTMPTIQIKDTALIDLINEVQKFYAKADISSATAFKNNINLRKGDFKKKDVANIYKYPNTLMGVKITGKNLKKYMEWSASYYNTFKPGDVTISFNQNIRGYNYDMFAGVNYDIDISQEAGNRIRNLTFNGKQIDDNAVYKLAVNNYRFGSLKGEGFITDADKYYDSYEIMQDAGRIRDFIIKYITEEKGGVVVPTVDNNWKIIGADIDEKYKDVVYDMINKGQITIPTSEDGRTPNVKSINTNELIKQGKLKEISVTKAA